MGILKRIFGGPAAVQQLPAGTVTVDRQGRIINSTVSSTFPVPLLEAIGGDVMDLFRAARVGEMPLAEVSLCFGSLRLTARELRGGAIIFMFPQTALSLLPTLTRA